MNLDSLSAVAARVFFWSSFALLTIAVLEFIVRAFGYTILRAWEPGRLLEYAIVLLTFVMAILLRQIRDRIART